MTVSYYYGDIVVILEDRDWNGIHLYKFKVSDLNDIETSKLYMMIQELRKLPEGATFRRHQAGDFYSQDYIDS
ncbi:hypothetical protein PM10SUCC1_02910 [Propionigenium maris DSM 9537]|uniref:Uncharacterized protein n=1 Tax=Propionigenium maris DSM 9537 TaxID=1123000 RepID=A0A9W6GJ32_9FUSO|nr:hypothetical protein [Propionigenium maris]GLI54776.1 hypothetical protein PM10SUCC1_02910 [Propionigenium maris DSM 9537]